MHCGHLIKKQTLLYLRRRVNKCQNCYKKELKDKLPMKREYYYMVKQYTLKSVKKYGDIFNSDNVDMN
ncbi:hypothetical protein AKJ59_00730 [candidate division MSBL1 archaeon SCGC-AAA385M02]|uniref:Uncharacterized protein n=1 Tax=candidate division MSBL1 archaeon SCGC-AAA385M02 TaxID=1698287 RepID=A0A133VQA6_9EURY|nr:hypothetical protein AKJ59_00730 [candidate division MSBL1 archaeon SCGC-AAA385M02]